jgi:hypothetical protein
VSRLSQKDVSQPAATARRSVEVAGLPNAAEAKAAKSASWELEKARLTEGGLVAGRALSFVAGGEL